RGQRCGSRIDRATGAGADGGHSTRIERAGGRAPPVPPRAAVGARPRGGGAGGAASGRAHEACNRARPGPGVSHGSRIDRRDRAAQSGVRRGTARGARHPPLASRCARSVAARGAAELNLNLEPVMASEMLQREDLTAYVVAGLPKSFLAKMRKLAEKERADAEVIQLDEELT